MPHQHQLAGDGTERRSAPSGNRLPEIPIYAAERPLITMENLLAAACRASNSALRGNRWLQIPLIFCAHGVFDILMPN